MTDINVNLSIFNLGGLKPVANKLIEKLSKAAGLWNRPLQMERDARAKVRADKILAKGTIEIAELEQRAEESRRNRDIMFQHNMESIAGRAIPLLESSATPERIEDDWLMHFSEKAKLVSDEEMQRIWARLLAGEANSPGTFAKRTLDCITTLEKDEALAFTAVCSFGWQISGLDLTPVILSTQVPPFSKHGMTFSALTNLDTIGLIDFEALAGCHLFKLPKRFEARYFGKTFQLEMNQDVGNIIQVGAVFLSKIGTQLAPISGAAPIEGVVDIVLRYWKSEGVKILNEPEGLGSESVYLGEGDL